MTYNVVVFRDRTDAGRQLAEKLAGYRLEDPIVLGLPRGGVIVAAEVARALRAPLDVFVARKLGAPGRPEFGIGAIAPGGVRVIDGPVVELFGLSPADVSQVICEETLEMARRLRRFRGNRPLPDLRERTVILVDDGMATGVTARAAVMALRKLHPRHLVLAVPGCSQQSAAQLLGEVDDFACVSAPADFRAVGLWYEEFSPVSDEEVIACLEEARGRHVEMAPAGSPASAARRWGVPTMKLLFATDGSKPAQDAAQFLAALPLPAGTTLDVLVVMEALSWLSPDWLKESVWRSASEAVAAAQKVLERDGIEIKQELREGQAAYEILCAAERMQADLIVVGSKGRTGVHGFFIGSAARSVAQNANQPVLVARAPRAGLRRAVLAIDGSEHAARAVELAACLPLPSATEVVVATVVRPFSSFGLLGTERAATDEVVAAVQKERRKEAEELLEKARADLEAAGRRVTSVVMEGDPATAILNLAAEQEADLILAGARGDSLVRRLALGSVADRLLKTARCSVLVAR